MMPKKEVVMNEDMQNLLQNIGQVKTEPVDTNYVSQPGEQSTNKANVDETGMDEVDHEPTLSVE